MINVVMKEKIVPISTILGLDYETTSYDQRVKARYDYVKEQLKNDPNYEGWDYPEVIGFGHDSGLTTSLSYLISSSGRFVSIISEGTYHLHNGSISSGYLEVSMRIDGKRTYYRKHRIVSCTYVPCPGEPNKMVPNHLDMNKKNNKFSNFEWCTHSDNTNHYRKEKGIESYSHMGLIGTYLLDDEYQGTVFCMEGTKQFRELTGLQATSVIQSAKDEIESAYGIKWEFGDKNCGPIPDFILSKIITDLPYLVSRIGPILFDQVNGELKFCVCGSEEIENLGLTKSKVYEHSKRGGVYKGFKLSRISRKEANLLPRGLTEEQKKTIFG